jgi:hypothetical protein
VIALPAIAAALAALYASALVGTFAFCLAVGCGARTFPVRAMLTSTLWGAAALLAFAIAQATP